jgi:hypothetical protein
MQEDMVAAQQEIEVDQFLCLQRRRRRCRGEGYQGTGSCELSVRISTVESKEDLEMLGDMIVAACNQAYKEIEKAIQEKMGQYQSLVVWFRRLCSDMKYPKPLENLIESFQLYPGIGPKTAERLAFLYLPRI